MKLTLVKPFVVVLVSCCASISVVPLTHAQTGVWDGIYSQEQATRGKTVYRETCASCHGEDFRGDSTSPSLIGMSFLFVWEERSLGELFTSIQTAMPPTDPNSLSRESYLDVLAYLMQANGFPAGEHALSAESGQYDQVLITGKP